MIKLFRAIGLQQQQQDKGNGGSKKTDKGYQDPLSELMRPANYRDLIQDIAGTIVGEYYQDKKEFAQNTALVREIQDDLVKLGYDLGTSGKDKNGVDGHMGGKTIQAFHNFELDHQKEIKEAAAIQKAIPKGYQR